MTGQRKEERTNGREGEVAEDRKTKICRDGRIEGWTHRRAEWRADGRMDGRKDERTEGRTDR